VKSKYDLTITNDSFGSYIRFEDGQIFGKKYLNFTCNANNSMGNRSHTTKLGTVCVNMLYIYHTWTRSDILRSLSRSAAKLRSCSEKMVRLRSRSRSAYVALALTLRIFKNLALALALISTSAERRAQCALSPSMIIQCYSYLLYGAFFC
jgi:hypothetical protein